MNSSTKQGNSSKASGFRRGLKLAIVLAAIALISYFVFQFGAGVVSGIKESMP